MLKKPMFFERNLTVYEKEKHTMLCEDLSEYYEKPLYWLPYKFNLYDIITHFDKLKEEGDRNFIHLMQKLNQ